MAKDRSLMIAIIGIAIMAFLVGIIFATNPEDNTSGYGGAAFLIKCSVGESAWCLRGCNLHCNHNLETINIVPELTTRSTLVYSCVCGAAAN